MSFPMEYQDQAMWDAYMPNGRPVVPHPGWMETMEPQDPGFKNSMPISHGPHHSQGLDIQTPGRPEEFAHQFSTTSRSPPDAHLPLTPWGQHSSGFGRGMHGVSLMYQDNAGDPLTESASSSNCDGMRMGTCFGASPMGPVVHVNCQPNSFVSESNTPFSSASPSVLPTTGSVSSESPYRSRGHSMVPREPTSGDESYSSTVPSPNAPSFNILTGAHYLGQQTPDSTLFVQLSSYQLDQSFQNPGIQNTQQSISMSSGTPSLSVPRPAHRGTSTSSLTSSEPPRTRKSPSNSLCRQKSPAPVSRQNPQTPASSPSSSGSSDTLWASDRTATPREASSEAAPLIPYEDREIDTADNLYHCEAPGCKCNGTKGFTRISALKRHEEVHLKPYLCPIAGCSRGLKGNGFSRTDNLETHLASKTLHSPSAGTLSQGKRKRGSTSSSDSYRSDQDGDVQFALFAQWKDQKLDDHLYVPRREMHHSRGSSASIESEFEEFQAWRQRQNARKIHKRQRK